MATVGGVAELGEAVRAGGGVRRDQSVRRSGRPARRDLEAVIAGGLDLLLADPLDVRQRRGLVAEAAQEPVEVGPRALDLDQHPPLVFEDMAGEPLPGREPVDVRTEPDPLDDALDPHPQPARLLPPDRARLGQTGRHG